MNGQPHGVGISYLGKLLNSLTDEVVLFFQVADKLVRRLITHNSFDDNQPLDLRNRLAPAKRSCEEDGTHGRKQNMAVAAAFLGRSTDRLAGSAKLRSFIS